MATAHNHDHAHALHAAPSHDGHGHHFVAANKAYYDEHAQKLEQMYPQWREMSGKQVEAFRAEWPELFDKERTAVMDFACGIGLISEALFKYVKSIVGVDISQASIDRYNAGASRHGFTPEQMKAVCLELKGTPGELDDAKFDVIICCAAYHHFASMDDITRVLAYYLKPGGSLLVADNKAEDDQRQLVPESYHGLVPHKHGISEQTLRTTFEDAGLGQFAMKVAGKEKMHFPGQDEMEITWFIARGIKPAESGA